MSCGRCIKDRPWQGLKQLVHGYEALVGDVTRVKNRLKALYRGRGLSSKGEAFYGRQQRQQWIAQLETKELQTRATYLYEELDSVLRRRAEAGAASFWPARLRECRQRLTSSAMLDTQSQLNLRP